MLRGIAADGRVRFAAALQQEAILDQAGDDWRGSFPEPASRFIRLQRPLIRRAMEMVGQNIRVVERNARLFVGSCKKFLGVAHPILIHRIVQRNQHAEAGLLAATSPAQLLPGARHGAGIAVQDCRI